MVTASSERQPVEMSCLPLENSEQESFSNNIDKGRIPQIVVHHSNLPNDDMSQFGQNDTEQNEPEVREAAEPLVEQKGFLGASWQCASQALSESLCFWS